MLSRVADSLYWMSRYSERLESNAHILGVQLMRMLEESNEPYQVQQGWQMILHICSSSEESKIIMDSNHTREIVEFLAFSSKNTNGLLQFIHYIRENARVTRDCIPNQLWEAWNTLYLDVQSKQLEKDWSLFDMHSFINRIYTTSMMTTGIIDSFMTRDLSYHFIKIGKWLERSEKTIRILQNIVNRNVKDDNGELSNLEGDLALQFVNGSDDYSSKYPFTTSKEILAYLLGDITCPKSVLYCLEHVREALLEIESRKVAHYSFEMFSTLEETIDVLKEMNVTERSLEEMLSFLNMLLKQCIMFSKIFSSTYYLLEPEMNK